MTQKPNRSPLVAVLAALFALALPVRARAVEERIFSRCSDVTLEGVEVSLVLEGMTWSGWDQECKRLVAFLRPGERPVEPTFAGEASRLLQATGFFEKAECRTTPDTVTCNLTPARIVYDVAIGGNVPRGILKDDLRSRVYLRPGTLLENEKEDVARQRKRLEDYMRREGYFGSVVQMKVEDVDEAQPNQGVLLEAQVQPGRTVMLRTVKIRGWIPPEYPAERIENGLRHYWLLWWARARFRPNQFDDDLLRITSEMQDAGYPEAEVDGKWNLDLTHGEADVVIEVDAGPKLELRFEGNHHLSTKKLRRLATFRQAGVVDPSEIENTAKALQKAYQEIGYYDVKITSKTELPNEHAIVVLYSVEEGPRAKVVKVSFTGEEAFSASTIRHDVDLLTTTGSLFSAGRWVDEFAEADARAIEAFFVDRGYAAAKVKASREVVGEGRLEAVFHIDEGPKRWVEKVTIEGLPKEVARGLLLSELHLTEGKPYVHSYLGTDRRDMLTKLAAAGYPNAVVHRDMQKPAPSEGGPVVIHYIVEPGLRALFGGVLVRGNFHTGRSVITDEIKLDPGEPLDLVVLGRARRRLRALAPLSSVELKPLDLWRKEEDTWLLVAVQERDVQSLDAVAAYSTDQGFQIGADYQNNNVFGRAMLFDARVRLGRFFGLLPFQIGNADTASGNLSAPHPLGVPVDADANVFYRFEDKTDFTEQRVGAGAGLSRALTKRLSCAYCPDSTTTLRYELQAGYYNDHTRRFIAFSQSYGLPQANIARIVPGLHLERRDSFTDPRKGYVSDLRFETALKALSPLPGASDFWRFITTDQFYLTLGTPFVAPLGGEKTFGGPVVLALSATWGAERPFGGSLLVPDTETFYYGGDYSVRGMTDRGSRAGFPGANYEFVGSVELRWYFLQNIVFGSFQLAPFTDVGAANYNFSTVFAEPTVSVGVALRYVTPVGPLSVAYGIGVVRPQAIVTSDPGAIPKSGRIHVTFGYPF